MLIDAYKEHYAFDICPGFWNAIDHHKAQTVSSIDHVLRELSAGNDALKDWAEHPSLIDFFQDTGTADVIVAYGQVMAWVQTLPNKQPLKARFATGADGWLIAYSMVNHTTVVTHERHGQSGIKIPDVGDHFNVRCITIPQMLRELGIRLNWIAPTA